MPTWRGWSYRCKMLREGKLSENDLLDRLVATPELKLTKARALELLQGGAESTGAAEAQVEAISQRALAWLVKVPAAAGYEPGDIL